MLSHWHLGAIIAFSIYFLLSGALSCCRPVPWAVIYRVGHISFVLQFRLQTKCQITLPLTGSWQTPSKLMVPRFTSPKESWPAQDRHRGHWAHGNRPELPKGLHADWQPQALPRGKAGLRAAPPLGGSSLGSEHCLWPLSSHNKF